MFARGPRDYQLSELSFMTGEQLAQTCARLESRKQLMEIWLSELHNERSKLQRHQTMLSERISRVEGSLGADASAPANGAAPPPQASQETVPEASPEAPPPLLPEAQPGQVPPPEAAPELEATWKTTEGLSGSGETTAASSSAGPMAGDGFVAQLQERLATGRQMSAPEELLVRQSEGGSVRLTWFYDERVLEQLADPAHPLRSLAFEVRQQSEAANGRLRSRVHHCECRTFVEGEEVGEQSFEIDGCAPGKAYAFTVRARAHFDGFGGPVYSPYSETVSLGELPLDAASNCDGPSTLAASTTVSTPRQAEFPSQAPSGAGTPLRPRAEVGGSPSAAPDASAASGGVGEASATAEPLAEAPGALAEEPAPDGFDDAARCSIEEQARRQVEEEVRRRAEAALRAELEAQRREEDARRQLEATRRRIEEEAAKRKAAEASKSRPAAQDAAVPAPAPAAEATPWRADGEVRLRVQEERLRLEREAQAAEAAREEAARRHDGGDGHGGPSQGYGEEQPGEAAGKVRGEASLGAAQLQSDPRDEEERRKAEEARRAEEDARRLAQEVRDRWETQGMSRAQDGAENSFVAAMDEDALQSRLDEQIRRRVEAESRRRAEAERQREEEARLEEEREEAARQNGNEETVTSPVGQTVDKRSPTRSPEKPSPQRSPTQQQLQQQYQQQVLQQQRSPRNERQLQTEGTTQRRLVEEVRRRAEEEIRKRVEEEARKTRSQMRSTSEFQGRLLGSRRSTGDGSLSTVADGLASSLRLPVTGGGGSYSSFAQGFAKYCQKKATEGGEEAAPAGVASHGVTPQVRRRSRSPAVAAATSPLSATSPALGGSVPRSPPGRRATTAAAGHTSSGEPSPEVQQRQPGGRVDLSGGKRPAPAVAATLSQQAVAQQAAAQQAATQQAAARQAAAQEAAHAAAQEAVAQGAAAQQAAAQDAAAQQAVAQQAAAQQAATQEAWYGRHLAPITEFTPSGGAAPPERIRLQPPRLSSQCAAQDAFSPTRRPSAPASFCMGGSLRSPATAPAMAGPPPAAWALAANDGLGPTVTQLPRRALPVGGDSRGPSMPHTPQMQQYPGEQQLAGVGLGMRIPEMTRAVDAGPHEQWRGHQQPGFYGTCAQVAPRSTSFASQGGRLPHSGLLSPTGAGAGLALGQGGMPGVSAASMQRATSFPQQGAQGPGVFPLMGSHRAASPPRRPAGSAAFSNMAGAQMPMQTGGCTPVSTQAPLPFNLNTPDLLNWAREQHAQRGQVRPSASYDSFDPPPPRSAAAARAMGGSSGAVDDGLDFGLSTLHDLPAPPRNAPAAQATPQGGFQPSGGHDAYGSRDRYSLTILTSDSRWETLSFFAGENLDQRGTAFLEQRGLKSAFHPGLVSKMRSMIAMGQAQASVDIVDLL